MEPYDVSSDNILAWAEEYAGYEELERTAKALYALYVQRRKVEEPEADTKARQQRKDFKRKPGRQRKSFRTREYKHPHNHYPMLLCKGVPVAVSGGGLPVATLLTE
jgi:hypothetical protein